MGKVTALMMDVITESSGHSMTGLAVSVCLTPAAPSPLPIPYPTMGSVAEGIDDPCLRTKIGGAKILTVGGCMSKCHGNEPGTLGEVVSLRTAGPCFPILGAPIVFIELGMAGITLSPGFMNKNPLPGIGGNASGAGGAAGGGSAAGPGGAAAPGGHGPGGPAGGGGSGGGGSHQGASPPGTSSGPADTHVCQNGHPVDVVRGHVVDQATDIQLPGPIPVVWKRYYSSARRKDASATLGPGWAHGYEQRIEDDGQVLVLREGEGRSVYFERVGPGKQTFHRRERMTLRCERPGRYSIFHHGSRLTYEFEAHKGGGAAWLRSIRDAFGNTVALWYTDGKLSQIVDTAGRELRVRWERDRITRLEVRARGKLEQWVDYAYHAAEPRCLAQAKDALGYADSYEYDRGGRMTATTIKRGVRFQYEYDKATGRCIHTWGPDGLYDIALDYDPGAKTTTLRGEEPRVYTWDDLGHATRIATPDGTVIEESAYDADGYLIAEVNGAGEGEKIWYDARGNWQRVIDASGATTTLEYDDRDLLVRKTAPDGLVTTYGRDERGALVSIVHPTGESFSFSYDDRGRLTAIFGAEGRLRAFEYDGDHNLVAETDTRGARTVYTYDALGRGTSRTDALGRTTRLHYDAMGRAIGVALPDGGTIQRAFDGHGQLVRETDMLGRTTTFEYSGMGVLKKLIPPDGKVWTFAHSGMERLREIVNPRGERYSFEYDQSGRLTSENSFDGRRLAYAYGTNGRVARIDYPDRSHRVFHYDRAGRNVGEEGSDGSRIGLRRDAVGRLLGAAYVEADGRRLDTLFERDRAGRVVATRQGDRVVRYAFDSRGRRAERILPNGIRTRYAYDAEGALSMVEHGGQKLVFERDTLGRESKRAAEGGRFSIRSEYDAMDRLLDQRVTGPAPAGGVPEALVQRRWEYDRGGRPARMDDARWGKTLYAHDKGDRLVEFQREALREFFSYDTAGALVAALEGLGAPREAWEIAPGNLLKRTERAKYTYDSRGRRTVKLDLRAPSKEASATEYEWDVRDRLREVKKPDGTRVVMFYDAFGRRTRKEVHSNGSAAPRSVEFVWDGDELAAEIDTERGPRSFAHAPGTFVPLMQEEGGEVFTYVNDFLGTPKELIDSTGAIAWSASHAAFGKVVDSYADPVVEQRRGRKTSSPFRLLGQYADEETGLAMTRFRHFDPEIGRWISPDPIGMAGGPDVFAFDGSPAWIVDPLGLAGGTPHPPRPAPDLTPHKMSPAEEAAVRETIDRIDGRLPAPAKGTLQAQQWGAPFRNTPRGSRPFPDLPRRQPGYYREYTVLLPGQTDRGSRRIVAGNGGELHYTTNHYGDEGGKPFTRLR